MKNSSLRFVLALLALVIGASSEELVPKFLDVGFPVLLAAVPVFAVRRPLVLPVMFALAAGGAEDALSGLPFMTSASFFLLLAALVRWTHLPALFAVFAYPAYQLWLCLWVTELEGSVFVRSLVAFPVGVLAFALVWGALAVLERKAGIDEAG